MTNLEKKVDALVRLCLCEDAVEKESIRNSLRVMIGESAKAPVPVPTNYHEKVKRVLIELGTPDHIKGHRYLIHAITLVIENPEYVEQVTSVLYPKVAKEFNTTSSRVERAIRHAIEVTWDRSSFDIMFKYFGNTVSASKGKPTNSEFIARMANELR